MPCGGMRPGLAALWALGSEQVQKDGLDSQEVKNWAKCPECGWQITGEFSWCPKCGTRLSPYQCDYCRGIVPKDQQECPRCGAPVA